MMFPLALTVWLAMLAPFSRTLTTPHFSVHITELCEEGVVGCDNVVYQSVSSVGRTLTLHGKQIMHMCPDGVTPCHPIGYQFRSGSVMYWIGENGTLTVTQGKKTLVDEMGKWSE